jgi:hypothetical protein
LRFVDSSSIEARSSTMGYRSGAYFSEFRLYIDELVRCGGRIPKSLVRKSEPSAELIRSRVRQSDTGSLEPSSSDSEHLDGALCDLIWVLRVEYQTLLRHTAVPVSFFGSAV